MTAASNEPPVTPAGPPVVFGPGRVRIFKTPDGLLLAVRDKLCETCSSCGCGTQVMTLPLPDPAKGKMALAQWMMTNQAEVRAAMAVFSGTEPEALEAAATDG